MDALLARLQAAQHQLMSDFPGDGGRRQPVHVVYGGAHLFNAGTAQKLGTLARQSLDTYAPEPALLAAALHLDLSLAERVYPRLLKKLATEPVEDLRIDFEDGFGHRSDDEEDAAAKKAAAEFRSATALPAFRGIRIKPLSVELAPRALRTLKTFLEGCGTSDLLVTLPKVVSLEQVRVLCDALDELGAKAARIEVMIEAPQSLALLPHLREAARGKLHAVHFGAYDFTAGLDITAAEQRLRHPLCDVARAQMKLAFAGTEIFVSDGATTQFPVPIHRGASLNPEQQRENRTAVHAAWRASADDIRHSLASGFYQGWDLHPAQLVARYGTVYAFFLKSLDAATKRLKNFVDELGQATLSGTSFDDAATGQGLLNFFLRGLSCGALEESDLAATGLTRDELASRSFAVIAKNRRK
ncbi:MAG: phosphoenolpyruvate kinase [Archangium sp.]